MNIAFDVDGCLIDEADKPRKKVIGLLKAFANFEGNTIIVWSGGGEEYARMWCTRLGIEKYVDFYDSKTNHMFHISLAFDDQDVKLADLNIKV